MKQNKFVSKAITLGLLGSLLSLGGSAVHAAEIPKPVLEVNFNNGTAEDVSGNANHGEITGNPEFSEGINGKAIHLKNSGNENDTARQYVDFGKSESLSFGEESFSVMFWYKADGDSSVEGNVIGNKDWSTGANPGFAVGDMREGITLNINTEGCERRDVWRYSQATDGTWHHVAAVVDRTGSKRMSLYVDGILMEDTDISNLTRSIDTKEWILGASHKADGSKFLGVEDAYIDNLSIYSEALTQEYIVNVVQQDQCFLETREIGIQVASILPGARYTEEAIATMQNSIDEAEFQMQENTERIGILEALQEEYEAFLEGNPADLSFHLVSDIHVGNNVNDGNAKNFASALQDMKQINPEAQAFLTAGDNTEWGSKEEMDTFYRILDTYNPVNDDQTMIALGNHDVRGNHWQDNPTEPTEEWKAIYQIYMEQNGKYMPDTQGKVYYDRWIDGYHFIVLNPENSAKDTAWMTEEQLDWLEIKIAEGKDSDKPAFVIIHQALNDTHYRSNEYGGFGNQDSQVKEILRKYPQTVFISGHIHNGLGTTLAMQREYGTMVDMPAFKGSENGLTKEGIGFEAYVYDTELYLRARDFLSQEWLPEYDISVQLPSLPVLYKEATELEEDNFTVESWQEAQAVLGEALPEVQSMLGKTYDTYSREAYLEMREWQNTLTEGLEKLETVTDRSSFESAIAWAEEFERKQKQNHCYTEATWQAVQTVLDRARILQKNSGATQKEIDQVFLELVTAINFLESDIQKIGLGTAIEGAGTILKKGAYTEESVKKVNTALVRAQEVYTKTDASQTEINQATTELLTAVTELLVKDKTERLDILLQKAEELLQKEDQYTDDSIQALKDVLEAAKEVAAKKDATEQEIKDAYNALAEAMTSLVRIANKAELKNALDKADEILANVEKYTDSSQEGLQEAKDVAQVVYDNDNATQEEIEEALKALINEILKVRILGDVNQDEAVDSADAQALLRYNAELEELNEEQLDAADVNRDEAADSSDAGMILQYAAEMIEEF